MSTVEILGLVNSVLREWGVMPYIQAILVILAVISAIVFIRRLGTGS